MAVYPSGGWIDVLFSHRCLFSFQLNSLDSREFIMRQDGQSRVLFPGPQLHNILPGIRGRIMMQVTCTHLHDTPLRGCKPSGTEH